jgi:hypothetical protein
MFDDPTGGLKLDRHNLENFLQGETWHPMISPLNIRMALQNFVRKLCSKFLATSMGS